MSGGSTELAMPRPTDLWRARGRGLLRRWRSYLLGALLLAVGLLLGAGMLLFAYFRSDTRGSGAAVETRPAVPATRPLLPGTAQLIVECGRHKNGKQELERGQPGFTYRRIQGDLFDDWAPTGLKTHCWYNGQRLQFQIDVPPGTGGFLRLFCYDADSAQRKQRVEVVQAKYAEEIEKFNGAGKTIELHLTPQQLKDGKIDVTIDNLGPVNAVISTVEFLTYRR
jgi:hypothetical protein